MTILFAPEAEADFLRAVSYLAERNPLAAQRLASRVFAALDRLAASECEGPEFQLATGEVVRSWPVPPLRIFYRRGADSLWVLRIYDVRREPLK